MGTQHDTEVELRHEVTALIGPCTRADAEDFVEGCAGAMPELGAVWSVRELADPDIEKYRARIVVYTRGWISDRQMEEGETPGAMIGSRVFVNGKELPWALGLQVKAPGDDFYTASLDIAPATIRFVPLTAEQWKLDNPGEPAE